METIRERIKLALDRAGKTQQDLADYLNIRKGSVSAVLNRDTEFDSLKYLEATEVLTGYSFDWLRTGNGPQTLAAPASVKGNISVLAYHKHLDLAKKVANPDSIRLISDVIDSCLHLQELETKVKSWASSAINS